MKGIGSILLAAGVAFAAAGESEPAGADSLEAQLLRFEAVAAKADLSVFRYEHLVPAATDVSSLPASSGAPVKDMLVTCATDVEALCQRTFGNDIASEKSRAEAISAGMDCLHKNFPRVSRECVHAAHGAAEAVAANGFESQTAVLTSKADAAMTAANAACSTQAIEAACSGDAVAHPTHPAPDQAPTRMHDKPSRGKGKGMSGRMGKRVLRFERERQGPPHHGPPPPAPPTPAQAKTWFVGATSLESDAVGTLGGSVDAAATCLAAMATPPPPRDSWFGHWHTGPPAEGAGGDACVEAANSWLHASTMGATVEAAAQGSASDAAVTTPRSTPPADDMRLEGWAVPGVADPTPCPMWGCEEEGDHKWRRRHHWDDDDEDEGGVWVLLVLVGLVSLCACRARRRCRRRQGQEGGGEGYWPSPREMRANHQAAVPTPGAATAAAVAAAAPQAAVPQYQYGATAAPVAAPMVPGGLYPDMPPAPSRWSLGNVFGRSSAPPAAAVGYAPVYTTEH